MIKPGLAMCWGYTIGWQPPSVMAQVSSQPFGQCPSSHTSATANLLPTCQPLLCWACRLDLVIAAEAKDQINSTSAVAGPLGSMSKLYIAISAQTPRGLMSPAASISTCSHGIFSIKSSKIGLTITFRPKPGCRFALFSSRHSYYIWKKIYC